MKAKGYEIKGENLSVDSPKYISFRPMESKNYIRGSAKSLGESYTKEKIRKTSFPKRLQTLDEIKIKSMDDIIKRAPKDITKASLTSTWKQHEKDLKNLESALSTLNEYIGKGAAESMQSHIQEEAREDDKTQSKKDQSL